MLRATGLISVFLATAAPAVACNVPFIRTFDNQTVSGSMVARAGKPCSIRLNRSLGPMYSAQIVERPANGSASVGAGNQIIYLSRRGFVGRDSFSYTRTGLSHSNAKVVRTVRIRVIVRP